MRADELLVSANDMTRLTQNILQTWSIANNLLLPGLVASGRDSWSGR